MAKILLQKLNKNTNKYETIEEIKNTTQAYQKLEAMKKNKEVHSSAGFIVETTRGELLRFVNSKDLTLLKYQPNLA